MGDWIPAILVLVCGVAVCLGGFVATRHYYRNIEAQAFAAQAARHADIVREGIERYVDAVSALATFVVASDRIDRWEFQRFADLSLHRLRGFAALAWVPRIPQRERHAFEAGVRRDGLFGLIIRQTDNDGTLVGAASRPEYYPVSHLVPFDGNEDALGFDLGSAPEYQRVLTLARDAGRLQATEILSLPIATQIGAAVWLVLPVYARGVTTNDTLTRRKALIGFAIGAMRVDGFMGEIFASVDPTEIDISLYDTTDSGAASLLFGSQGAEQRPLIKGKGEIAPSQLVGTSSFDVAGRQWLLVDIARSKRSVRAADLAPWVVALLAALSTALLVQHLIDSVLLRRNVEHAVRQRTTELALRNDELRVEIAQRQRTEIDLRLAKEEAETASRTKSEFLTNMSHELRTPLNAIIGFAELLMGNTGAALGPDKSHSYAVDIRSSGAHLLALINDILDLSKAEVGKIEIRETLVELDHAIADCLAMVRARAESTGISLVTRIAADLPLLYADERKLKQILLNLLSNAVKFTPEGGTVTVAASGDTKTGLTVTIADTGIGIAKADFERAFDPFVQLDSSLARKYEGTGLGLALARRWAQLHGATLTLDSEPGVGTTVKLRFPKERAAVGSATTGPEGGSHSGGHTEAA